MTTLAYPKEIIDSKFENNTCFYLVQWKGCETPAWEPAHHIDHRTDLIDQYRDMRMINQLGLQTGGYIYCRVSSKEQSKYNNGHTSLQVQEQEMRKYCDENDIKVIDVIHEVYSARDMDKLKGLHYLCNIAAAGQTIYVYDISRFSRNAHHALNVLEYLKSRNIKVKSITENVTYGSASEKNHFRLQLCASTYYSDMTSQKIKASIAFRRARGDYIGRTPYGYSTEVDEKTQVRSKIVNEEEMNIIHKIMKLSKKYPEHILEVLNKDNVKIRGKTPKISTIKRIIKRFSAKTSTYTESRKAPKRTYKTRKTPY